MDKIWKGESSLSRFSFSTLLHLLVAAYRGVFRTWMNFYKGAFFAKILNGFNLLTILAKKALSQMFDWVGNRLLARDLKY